ncbi:MAG TPA: hypothetical protein VKB21_00650 [Candidatus Acidoferrum sp.]|nr:hypothetical protein [Candidatus Acidoferrum sp.]
MKSIACPRCGSPVPLRRFLNATTKPFCARCGWNLDRAEAAIANNQVTMKLIPLAIAAVGVFFACMAARTGSPVLFWLPALFAAILLLPIWGYFSTRRAIAAAKTSIHPAAPVSQTILDASLQQLQALPRPRRIRLRFQGSVAAAIALLLMAVFALVGVFLSAHASRNLPHGGDSFAPFVPMLSVLAVFLVVVILPWVRAKRDAPLLRDGELAFARVTSQQTVQQGKTSYSRIDYEFKTSCGQLIRNSAKDLSQAVFEEMTIPVFYDPLDPARNLTPCATYLRVSTDPF